jgi:hypothetical protein
VTWMLRGLPLRLGGWIHVGRKTRSLRRLRMTLEPPQSVSRAGLLVLFDEGIVAHERVATMDGTRGELDRARAD